MLVQLEDPQENALVAEGLSVALTSPDSRIAPDRDSGRADRERHMARADGLFQRRADGTLRFG